MSRSKPEKTPDGNVVNLSTLRAVVRHFRKRPADPKREKLFRELVWKTVLDCAWDDLIPFARSRLPKARHGVDAEDVRDVAVMETFAVVSRLALNGRLWEIKENPENYIRKIMLNEIKDEVAGETRKTCRCVQLIEELATPNQPALHTDSSQEKIDQLRRAISDLRPLDRSILDGRYWRGLSFAAIAESIGINEGTARVREHRLRGRLKQRLNI